MDEKFVEEALELLKGIDEEHLESYRDGTLNPFLALQLYIRRHEGFILYVLLEEVAQSLAQVQVPTFASEDEDTVFETFCRLFQLRPFDWKVCMLWLRERIYTLSQRKLILEEVDFYTGIRGMNKTFLLKGGDIEQKVVLGPYIPPVTFWKS